MLNALDSNSGQPLLENNQPDMRPELVIDHRVIPHIVPRISVVIPFFNQEEIITSNLASLVDSMSQSYELILINDASTDSSLRLVVSWIEKLSDNFPDYLQRVRLFSFPAEVFETSCDSFGFSISEGEFLLEIQADMKIYEKGFDSKLVEALCAWKDLIMISGRGTLAFDSVIHDFNRDCTSADRSFLIALAHFVALSLSKRLASSIKTWKGESKLLTRLVSQLSRVDPLQDGAFSCFPPSDRFFHQRAAGRLGHLISRNPLPSELNQNKIWVGEAVMRGPLIIRRSAYEAVGGLDREIFSLGYDDCDLAARAYLTHRLRCGFVPVGFSSQLRFGSSRKNRKLKTWRRLYPRMRNMARKKDLSSLVKISRLDKSLLAGFEVRTF